MAKVDYISAINPNANLNVDELSCIIKYAVPVVSPPIFPPLPFVYVTLCP